MKKCRGRTPSVMPRLSNTVVIERPAKLSATPAFPAALVTDAVLSCILPEIAGKSAVDHALLDLFDGLEVGQVMTILLQVSVADVKDAVFEKEDVLHEEKDADEFLWLEGGERYGVL